MAAWSDKDVLTLIETYLSHSVLWDPKNENHFKKNVKEDVWRDIGATIGRPADECKKKTVALLGSYRRERSKEKRSRTTGTGAAEVYKSRWFAYEAMGFLSERNEPRQTLNTETVDVATGETQIQIEESGEENQSSVQNEELLFTTPKPPKRAKTNERNQSINMMASAFQILQTAAGKMNVPPSEDDEVTSFFKYVSTKVKTYSPETRRGVQQAVFDILMKADRGLYEWSPENAFHGYQQKISARDTRPVTETSHQSAPAFPSHSSQPQLTQLTTVHQTQSLQGVSTIYPSIHVPTCSGLSYDDSTQFSTTPPVPSPSQQSQFSTSSDDLDDYV